MNKKQRKAIAQELATIAGGHGAVVEQVEDPRYRCITVDADFGTIRVSIDVDDERPFVAHWHRSQHAIKGSKLFNSVNDFHRRKATQWAYEAEDFTEVFRKACEAVASGSVFDLKGGK